MNHRPVKEQPKVLKWEIYDLAEAMEMRDSERVFVVWEIGE